MTTNKQRLVHLFQLYINGTTTPAEEDELMLLIAQSNSSTDIDSIMQDVWEDSEHTISIDAARSKKIIDSITLRKNKSFVHLFRIAAALLVVLLVVGAISYNIDLTKEHVAKELLRVESGHRLVLLPDSSTVILNEGSELTFPKTFDGIMIREVFLTGEGFFDVRHDREKPFIVHAGNLQTKVLGTAFNIRAYRNQAEIIVTVRRGKVQVSDDDKLIGIISQDQQITFNKTRNASAQTAIESENTVRWAEQDIFFDDVTLAQAVARLDERFGVKIEFANIRISQCRFTATFIRGENLKEILEVICEFNHAVIEMQGNDRIVIDGPGC